MLTTGNTLWHFVLRKYALYNQMQKKFLEFKKKGKIMNNENIPHFTNSAGFSY